MANRMTNDLTLDMLSIDDLESVLFNGGNTDAIVELERRIDNGQTVAVKFDSIGFNADAKKIRATIAKAQRIIDRWYANGNA